MKRVLLLVGSPRGPDSTSQSLGGYLLECLAEKDHETKRIGIYSALRKDQGLDEIIKAVEDADLFI
ncbi:MAG TPA: NADPH-dependent FMN reductase, partial [Acidobacteriota bacterium]